jgi:hypothetical protein
MKRRYCAVALVFAVGLGLVIYATSNTDTLMLSGIIIHPHVIKGLGLITMILGVLAFLAVYGSSLPPNRAERRKIVPLHDGDVAVRENHRKCPPMTARRVRRRLRVKTPAAEERADSLS